MHKQSRKFYWDRTDCLIQVGPSKPGPTQVPPQRPPAGGKVGVLAFSSFS